MLQLWGDLVVELRPVDGGSAAAGAGGVAGLDHEGGDDAVEEEVGVVAAAGEGFEVFAGLEEGVRVWGGGVVVGGADGLWERGRCRVLLLWCPVSH